MGFSSGVYTRTNGTFSGTTVWTQDKNAGTKITSSNHDTHDQDIANALSACLLKDGTQTVTADIPLSTYKLTNIGRATLTTDAIQLNQVQRSETIWGGITTGYTTVFSANAVPAITSYNAGLMVNFITDHFSASPTLGLNGLAQTIVRSFGGTAAATFAPNSLYTAIYDGTYFRVR